jgi:hypothetical protein
MGRGGGRLAAMSPGRFKSGQSINNFTLTMVSILKLVH